MRPQGYPGLSHFGYDVASPHRLPIGNQRFGDVPIQAVHRLVVQFLIVANQHRPSKKVQAGSEGQYVIEAGPDDHAVAHSHNGRSHGILDVDPMMPQVFAAVVGAERIVGAAPCSKSAAKRAGEPKMILGLGRVRQVKAAG